MIKLYNLVLAVLVLALASDMILAQEVSSQFDGRDVHMKRDHDSFKVFNRKRNAHACIMSIVFIVLYPLGAISIHLPIDRMPLLRNTYLKKKVPAIHAPIQLIAFVMMIGGMGLGLRLGHDLGYLRHPVHAHVVIGLLVVSTIIVFQPIMGILQHRHFKRTGGKSIFAYIHRWIGRCAIILGMINNGLGFQLASSNVVIPSSSYIRNFVLLGILVTIWASLVAYDEFWGRKSTVAVGGGGKGSLDDARLTRNGAAGVNRETSSA